MKKLFSFFALLINIAFLSYAQESDIHPADIVGRLWGDKAKPAITNLAYTYTENRSELTISFIDDIEITMDTFYDRLGDDQVIEITKAGEPLYSFLSPYPMGYGPYFYGAYRIQLSPGSPYTVLLATFPIGASGLSASMSFGILIDIEAKNYQLVSTYGSVEDNFVDIDGNGEFEFISVDIDGSRSDPENLKQIANIFSQDGSGFYTVNNSMQESYVYVLFFEDFRIERVDRREVGLRISPDVFEFDNMSYGDN